MYEATAFFNGKPTAGLAIKLASGANALLTSDLVDKKMEELSHFFPEKYEYVIPFDTTPFVRISIEGVIHTLLEAIVLVVLVMYLFLQNFRATLIPTIAVPVVVLGTFGILGAMGYSINMLTMFAMVLAIGLLVDDAIVVVENVERVMDQERLSPHDATEKSMSQITGRSGRYCDGAFCRVRSDGFLRRLYRCDLPSVLRHDCGCDGPVRPGCPDADTGTLCHDS